MRRNVPTSPTHQVAPGKKNTHKNNSQSRNGLRDNGSSTMYLQLQRRGTENLVPDKYLGPILQLCEERRGVQVELTYVDTRAMAVYRLPLNEVVFDFYDRLKSLSSGYASFDYELADYAESDLVKVSILVNGEVVDALAFIVHASHAESRGRQICGRLKDLIPRQLCKIAIQAAIGGTVIARTTIGALRKDVTAKCYGGDITRKKKLLEKQKKGKKKMRQIGNVEIPQSAFLAALKFDEN